MKKRRRIKRERPASEAELEEFKTFLGPLAADYTDSELRQLRREMHIMAEILVDLHLSKDKKSEPPTIQF